MRGGETGRNPTGRESEIMQTPPTPTSWCIFLPRMLCKYSSILFRNSHKSQQTLSPTPSASSLIPATHKNASLASAVAAASTRSAHQAPPDTERPSMMDEAWINHERGDGDTNTHRAGPQEGASGRQAASKWSCYTGSGETLLDQKPQSRVRAKDWRYIFAWFPDKRGNLGLT